MNRTAPTPNKVGKWHCTMQISDFFFLIAKDENLPATRLLKQPDLLVRVKMVRAKF